jgi:hypothetical protein
LCPLAQPLKKAAIPAIKNATIPNKAEKLLALIDSPRLQLKEKQGYMKLRQQSAIRRQHAARRGLPPPSGKNAKRAGFMQNMFRPAPLSSNETVTAAEIDF